MYDVETVKRQDLGKLFVACIFENGADDDLLGIVAAIESRPVLYRGKIYGETEDIYIFGAQIYLSCNDIKVDGVSIVETVSGFPSGEPVANLKSGQRNVTMENCHIHFNYHTLP